MSANNAEIYAGFGATGSGKSLFAKTWLIERKPARLLIWDPQDEYGQFAKAVPHLQALGQGTAGPKFALRYVPPKALEPKDLYVKFNAFCAVACRRGNLTMLTEELQKVTQSGWAPTWWEEATGRGRHYGLVIFGLSQRPASVDKNFTGNATYVYSGRLNEDADLKRLAGVLGVPKADMAALQKRHLIMRNMDTGEVSRLEVKIPRGLKPPPPRPL